MFSGNGDLRPHGLLGGFAHVAQGDRRHVEQRGDVFVGNAVDEAGVLTQEPFIPLGGGVLVDGDLEVPVQRHRPQQKPLVDLHEAGVSGQQLLDFGDGNEDQFAVFQGFQGDGGGLGEVAVRHDGGPGAEDNAVGDVLAVGIAGHAAQNAVEQKGNMGGHGAAFDGNLSGFQ